TTEALEPMDWRHHRLPRFLTAEEMRPWLEGGMDESWVQPAPKDLRAMLAVREVDEAVGNGGDEYREVSGGGGHRKGKRGLLVQALTRGRGDRRRRKCLHGVGLWNQWLLPTSFSALRG